MRRPLVIVLGTLVSLIATPPAHAQGKDEPVEVKVVNATRVYHPSMAAPGVYKKKKPALVRTREVFDATPEYKKIKKEKVKKNSAEYRLLVTAASNRFKKAMKRVISASGYDLIAEMGAVTVEGRTLPDITQEVIDRLQ